MILPMSTIAAILVISGGALAQTKKFSPIDCARSEIVLPRYTECHRTNFHPGAAYGSSTAGEYYDQSAAYRDESTVTYVMLQRSRYTGGSFVYSAAGRDSLLSRVTANVIRKGTNFSQEMRVSNGHIKTFQMDGFNCFSFVRDAPYKGSGVEHYLYGYACGRTADWSDEKFASRFMAAIGIKRAR